MGEVVVNPGRKRHSYSPNYGTQAKVWFVQNFKLSVGGRVFLSQIINLYESQKDCLQFSLDESALGRIVRDVYGESVEIKKVAVGSVYARVYVNITVRERDECEFMVDSSIGRNSVIGDWIVKERVDYLVRLAKISTGKFVHNCEYSPEVVIDFRGRTFTTKGLNGTQCCNEDLKYCSKDIELWSNVEIILTFLDSLGVCTGFELHAGQVPKDNEAHQLQGVNSSGQSVVKFLSHKCLVFSAKDGFCCSSCASLRKSLSKRSTRAIKRKPSEKRNFNCVRNDYLTREELEEKSKDTKNQKRNAVRREMYSKSKFEDEAFDVATEDHLDLKILMSAVDTTKLSPTMQLLLQQQEMALSRKSGGYRWHPRIIRLCLDVYALSPKAFDKTKEFMILPSKRLIRYYKNSIPKTSGWSSEVMLWCREEARRLNLKEEDLWGGLIFDEMTIQEDLQFATVHGKKKLVGGVSLGRTYGDMNVLSGKDQVVELATKVMQFALVTDRGFRFALAHFPVSSLTPATLLEKFWEGVEWCLKANFRIYWTLCDGGEPNRTFVKMLFGGSDPVEKKFACYNVHTGGKLAVMIDCKHNFKKIRNNLEKSSEKGPRQLKRNGVHISFQHWKDAYLWDLTHSLKIHQKLSENHFNTDPRTKMRNSLAEDVLDGEMKNLMMFYRNSVASELPSEKLRGLDEAIHLVKNTSELIDLFHSKQAISGVADSRIVKAKEFIEDLREWKGECASPKNFLSEKLWFDLQSMVFGLEQAVAIKSTAFPGSLLKPVIMNQDILENVFCQVRGSSGQNNNPNYYLYSGIVCSINIGQTVLSKKGNTGGDTTALPQASLPNLHPFAKDHPEKGRKTTEQKTP